LWGLNLKFPATAIATLVLAAGCLSSAPRQATSWTLDAGTAVRMPGAEPKPVFAATRLGAVSVLAPYDQTAFAVRRADGSIAFDPDNAFAAPPSALLKSPLVTALAGDGRFGHVVTPTSTVSADAIVEVTVGELALDCRDAAQRKARASLSVNVIKNGRDREVILSGSGAGEADAAGGDYSAAFSTAVNTAVNQALTGLK